MAATTGWIIPAASLWQAQDTAQAERLGLTCLAQPPQTGFYLARDTHGRLALRHAEVPNDPGLYSTLLDAKTLTARLAGGRKSPLARALGLHRHSPVSVLDATAGLGRDAATLAALGCSVMALERQPALYALLLDAQNTIQNLETRPGWWPNWQGIAQADARDWLTGQSACFDTIYIDPMFVSPRRKAAPQKAMAWLAALAGADADTPALLATARQYARRRVVVKQHNRAQPLAPPDVQMQGRAIRFDIYLTG